MSKLLDKEVIEQVKEAFQALDEDLQILFFEGDDCEYCSDTQQLVEEVADLTDKIHLNIYHLDHDQETAKRYNVDKAPGLVIASQNGSGAVDHGIRYAGIPSGHEFSSLIQSLLMVSSG
ncbi:MAG: thioredoxin family protein, partial [Anaerolineales bacterium]|nr:thioredoxin family protein [Anaerolineales bacterium]